MLIMVLKYIAQTSLIVITALPVFAPKKFRYSEKRRARWYLIIAVVLICLSVALDIRSAHQTQKLEAGLKRVEEVALGDRFKPADQELRKQCVGRLVALRQSREGNVPRFIIGSEKGLQSRSLVAEEIRDILQEAGYEVAESTTERLSFGGGDPSNIFISTTRQYLDFVGELNQAIQPLLDTGFVVDRDLDFKEGQLSFSVRGEPVFSPNGAISFKQTF